MILYSKVQLKDFTLTLSQLFLPNIAFQTKDSLEIFGTSAKISASVVPTIL
ncbi:MAG: hypothetical protein U9Q66_03020 [Patescibacteria group bacterium]|nr:hypothetical protein [Patescibacteria group bacterium]